MANHVLIKIKDLEDSTWDQEFLLYKEIYNELKPLIDKIYDLYGDGSPIPDFKGINRSLVLGYVNGDISWYNFLTELFSEYSIRYEFVTYDA